MSTPHPAARSATAGPEPTTRGADLPDQPDQPDVVLDVSGLHVRSHRRGRTRADLVRDASFQLRRGELLCLVGESGSGKSVTSLALMGLIQQQAGITAGGSARFGDLDLMACSPEEVRRLRGREIAMIFQDPMSSLDPVFRIEKQLVESLRRRERLSGRAEHDRAVDLLRRVGISDPERCLSQYPHQLSGGMCQRVMIAMALAARPEVLIADEPTTALDVTIQAQILALLTTLREETGTAVLLITHDMGVAAQVADQVAVMYAGRVVEQGTPHALFAQPRHPYTSGLLSCIPSIRGERPVFLPAIAGNVPDPARLPTGCAFHPRCPLAVDRCLTSDPPLETHDGRTTACWRSDELASGAVALDFGFGTRVDEDVEPHPDAGATTPANAHGAEDHDPPTTTTREARP